MTHEEMLEEAARRESDNDDDFGQLAYLERLELEEKSKTESANELYRDALHELDNLAVGDVDSEDFMNAYLIIQSALKVALGEEDV